MTRAVVADVDRHPELVQRSRRGLDRWDEVWEGVVHMVPPPSGPHQELGTALLVALQPFARAAGLRIAYEIGVWRHDRDYRIPDLSVYAPARASRRGVEGPPALVVELRSPGDETDAKIPWYLELGVAEVLVVGDGGRTVEVHTRTGVASAPVRLATLDVALETEPELAMVGPDGVRQSVAA